jgi:hypothetical protein
MDESSWPADWIVVVSGLPRSGTSMMMRMLEAGGVEPFTDNVRAADESNPMGYYEHESVKNLKDGDTAWLDSARGRALKVVSPLLEHLPSRYDYKLMFMVRDIEEIMASQGSMLGEGREWQGPPQDDDMAAVYRKHLKAVQSWLGDQPNVDVLYLRYRDIVEDPAGNVSIIEDFLGRELDHSAMINAVDADLYRQRSEPLWRSPG